MPRLPEKVILCALLLSAAAPAKTLRLGFVLGDVSIEGAAQKRPAKAGATLNEGEALRSGADGLALIEAEDGSKFKLNESSLLRLSASGRMDLEAGSLFSKGTERAGAPALEMGFKTIKVLSRGGAFFAAYGRSSSRGEDLWLSVLKGDVRIQGSGVASKRIKAGEALFVGSGPRVGASRPYKWDDELNWNFEGSGDELRNRVSVEAAYKDLLNPEGS